MRLLLVEDSPDLCELLKRGLAEEGFDTDIATSTAAAATALASTHFAAIILDPGLPDGDGLAVLKALRARQDPTPVIILTARSAVRHRVEALREGADDYLVKPFAFDELVVRLRALLRRPGDLMGVSLRLGDVVLDTEARQVFVANRAQFFSAREIDLLEILLRRGGQVVPREELGVQLGLATEAGSNAVEVYVHRLRKQLAEVGAKLQVHTIRGVGYVLTERP